MEQGLQLRYAPGLAAATAWIVALAASGTAAQWLGSCHAYGAHTRAQVSLAIGLCGILATWAAAEVDLQLRKLLARRGKAYTAVAVADTESPAPSPSTVGSPDATEPSTSPAVVGAPDQDAAVSQAVALSLPGVSKANGTTAVAQPGADAAPEGGLAAALLPLRASAELSAILAFVYLCDRTEVFPKADKIYDPTRFWGVWALICVAALATTQKVDSAKPLQRDQTDEWKGWMQIMFLMYHYFAEKEVYNAIRVYIAAYVWMTGYGNFFLYAKGKSFTTRRTLQMLFRLNFLGFLICVALNNEYLLYYICGMHTFFTVLVVLALYIRSDLNGSVRAVYGKLAATLAVTVLLYDGPSIIFRLLFGTLPMVKPFFAFHDPLHPEFTDELHEWHFRSGLDRFVWIVGMAYALHVGQVERLLDKVASLTPRIVGVLAHVALALPALGIGYVWWQHVFRLPKYQYNKMHPFTSFIPITVFLLLRNLLPALRRRYLWLFAFLGKVTLETYILQFHVWMRSTGVNGSPKYLLQWVPGTFYTNMALTTAVYIMLSFRIFHITTTLRDALIVEDLKSTAFRFAGVLAGAMACWGLSFLFLGSGAPFAVAAP